MRVMNATVGRRKAISGSIAKLHWRQVNGRTTNVVRRWWPEGG